MNTFFTILKKRRFWIFIAIVIILIFALYRPEQNILETLNPREQRFAKMHEESLLEVLEDPLRYADKIISSHRWGGSTPTEYVRSIYCLAKMNAKRAIKITDAIEEKHILTSNDAKKYIQFQSALSGRLYTRNPDIFNDSLCD